MVRTKSVRAMHIQQMACRQASTKYDRSIRGRFNHDMQGYSHRKINNYLAQIRIRRAEDNSWRRSHGLRLQNN